MTKIDIFSGFLGAGKTTLIKKLVREAYAGEKIVIIENEFGEIGIDGGFLKEAGIRVNEMNSGCICCSLVGDFAAALTKVANEYSPDRILIEPSGVGKLSDVIRAVETTVGANTVLNSYTAVVDANKCSMYMRNFGEFFNDQIESAGCIIFSHTDVASEKKVAEAAALVKEHNPEAVLVTTPWSMLDGSKLLEAIEMTSSVKKDLEKMEHEHCHHHDGECDCGHEHHHHDGECDCGHEHHHHHADDVFTSWGTETVAKYTKEKLEEILEELVDNSKYGMVLRAKGIVREVSGGWLHFDYVPGEADVRVGTPEVTGKICVIGSGIKENEIAKIFGI